VLIKHNYGELVMPGDEIAFSKGNMNVTGGFTSMEEMQDLVQAKRKRTQITWREYKITKENERKQNNRIVGHQTECILSCDAPSMGVFVRGDKAKMCYLSCSSMKSTYTCIYKTNSTVEIANRCSLFFEHGKHILFSN
jgi:hypothetical protein